MISRRFLASCIGTVAWLATVTAAAHAFLDHAAPAVGSTVGESPKSIRLWFSEHLEPTFSQVHVVDASGTNVDSGDSHVDRSDASLLTVSVPALPAGTYRVRWRVVSVDTHVTEGDFTFEIKR